MRKELGFRESFQGDKILGGSEALRIGQGVWNTGEWFLICILVPSAYSNRCYTFFVNECFAMLLYVFPLSRLGSFMELGGREMEGWMDACVDSAGGWG